MAKEMEKKQKKGVSHTGAEHMVDRENAYIPDVDIYANENELLFYADLPGVKKGDVSIEINESDVLVISAKSSEKEESEPVTRQYNVGNYYRSFQLSDEYNKDKIEASMENGVLKLRIPKREEAKPKKIEISA